MLSFTLSVNISMDNHQWRLSQAYTYAFHITIHIHITFITYHLYMLISCQPFSRYLYYVFSISFIYTFTVFLYFSSFCSMTYCIPCTIHILHIHLYVLILSYTLCFRILFVLFLYCLKANTFISYLYFSYYVNFYLIFHISRRSIRLILLLSYHILSYVFMCFHILSFSYTFLFYLLSILYLFISFSCTILCTFHILYSCCFYTIFIYLYSCTIHFLYCFPIILFIWLSLLCTCICCHILSYDIHILCFSSYTVIYYTFI